MRAWCATAAIAAAGAVLCTTAAAQPAPPAPAFDVAYRAWEVVMAVAKHNKDPSIGGDCGKTFRRFVVPGLKGQTKREQDVAAMVCYDTARAVCGNGRLQRTAEMTKQCEEFR